MRYNYAKLFLIYKFTILGESNDKLFQDIAEEGKLTENIGFEFKNATEQEQNKFLREWAKENYIKCSNYITIIDKKPKISENGIPYICYKKSVIIN